MVKHPGPDREFSEWRRAKKRRCLGGVDCGSAALPHCKRWTGDQLSVPFGIAWR